MNQAKHPMRIINNAAVQSQAKVKDCDVLHAVGDAFDYDEGDVVGAGYRESRPECSKRRD